MTSIRARQGWSSADVREIWANRELLYFLIWRDLKVRYKQTVFGALWAVIQPLALMTVFSLFLGALPGIAPAGIPYPLFALAGLVPWTLFSQSLVGSSSSLIGSSNLIQKVYFPRLLLPIASVGSFILDFSISLALLVLLILYFGSPLTVNLVWVLPLTLLTLLTALAVGTWFAAVNVRYRDVRYVVPFLVQVWLFASPVAYSSALVPADLQGLYQLNPMAGIIEGFRWALLGDGASPPLGAILTSAAVTAVVLVGGLAYFRHVERTFADVI